MIITHAAEYYEGLRIQGLGHQRAVEHTNQRFGICEADFMAVIWDRADRGESVAL
jgi:hypothetical protein